MIKHPNPFYINVILFAEEVKSKPKFCPVDFLVPVSVDFVKHVAQILGNIVDQL